MDRFYLGRTQCFCGMPACIHPFVYTLFIYSIFLIKKKVKDELVAWRRVKKSWVGLEIGSFGYLVGYLELEGEKLMDF